jgi:excisionase family DNA binding protein
MSVLISVTEACEKFSLNKGTVLNWIKTGKIPAVKVGKAYMINPNVLKGKRPKFENLYSKLSNNEVRRICFKIHRFRLTLGMRQIDFAKFFGVDCGRISRAENGITLSSDLYLAIEREMRKRGYNG